MVSFGKQVLCAHPSAQALSTGDQGLPHLWGSVSYSMVSCSVWPTRIVGYIGYFSA